ncbi:uncharacterized protein [Periplaneta americana]|uniref:uncharacterized protein isoform X2 n=1 Tax=Periplaneta americana TaxID=6978 RepID=UPI0037E85F7E
MEDLERYCEGLDVEKTDSDDDDDGNNADAFQFLFQTCHVAVERSGDADVNSCHFLPQPHHEMAEREDDPLTDVEEKKPLSEGYKKTDGACRIKGYMYEIKLAGLLFLRLINEKKRFHIASYMDVAGQFDDLVLSIDGKAVFVQLKHKLGAQASERKLHTVHRIFRIEKLYSSYCNLKKDWEEKTDLQLWGPFSDVRFVVYTNAVVAVGEAVDTDVQNVLMTGGKCLRFSENDFPKLKNEPEFNQFLHQFRLYTEQASLKQLDSLIRTELLKALSTDSQVQTFLTDIMDWMGGPGSYLTENVQFWKDIVKCALDDLNKAKIDQLAKFNLQFDDRELNLIKQQLPEGGGLQRVQNSTSMEAGYEKTGAAWRNEGYIYEVKIAGLLFLKLINVRKSFHIVSNMDAAGQFDDLVLSIDGKAAFVQLKHKLGAQVSERKRLYTVRRIFTIEKLYSSYCDLKKHWEDKTDLQRWGPFSDVQFVVYTNAVVAEGEAVDTDVQNVLMTGGKCIHFSENDFPELRNKPDFNQFLHQFRLYTEQSSLKQLDSLIRNELHMALGTDCQFQTFLTDIRNWMEGPGSYLTENVQFWKDIVKCSVDDLNKAKIDQLAKFNLQFDERELNLFRQQLPEGGGLLRVQNSNALTCLKVHQSVDKKILVDANVLEDRMSEVLVLWGRWPGCDVLVIDGWVEAIEKVVHNLGLGKTLVVIDDSENGMEIECLSHKDEFRFGQLNEESKTQVLDCKIHFQGESITLNTLVDNTVFDKVANAEIVTQLVSGIAESIGDKLTQQSEHYIPRKFCSREHVSETVFSDDRECLVVSGVSLQALRKIVEIFDETKHSDEGVCRCFVIGGKDDFDKAKTVFERVHWLHKEETGFIWKQSKGSVSYIKSHLMDKTSIRSLQEVMLLSDKVKLLVAHPGMGKSTEIFTLAQEFKRREPACWVVTVVLSEHIDYLSGCSDSAVELLLQAGKFKNDFAKSLFKHELDHGGNIVILIDGFDEICPDYTGKVLHMLRQFIIHCKFKQLWITSRSFLKEMLEESFSRLSFELQPFTKQDQHDFLAKLWNDMSDGPYNLDIFIACVLEVTGNSLNDKLGQFTEIPLQTRMLAEVFRSEASHFCQSGEMNIDRKLNLLELANRFVDRKWNIFVSEKGRVDVTNLVQHRILRLLRKEYVNDHMACAVHSLLTTEDFNRLQSSKDIMRRVEGFQDQFRNGNEKSGIVAQIVNSKAMFIHRTFLEFFAGKWFTKNVEHEGEYIKQILLREEFVIVREFFDRILAEGFELHTAILNEDKDYVLKLLSSPECDMNGKDKGGRTPLHLAVINHAESSNFSPNKTVCEIIELLLQNHCDCNAEDGVFHWRPLTLADKIQAWSAADMLLGSGAESSDMIFTMELIEGEQGDQFLCRLLKIVALQGYVNIAKLMFKCGLCVNHPLEAHFNTNIYPNAITATLLHIASSAGQTKLVEFLLEAEETEGFLKKRALVGDDNQLHLDTEKTSVYTTTKERLEMRDSDHRTPLFWAAVKGRLETVKMLVGKGANVNTDDACKQTPLYYAISGCHAEVVKFLIENGANVKVCDKDGDSVIFTALLSGNLDILRLLIDKGADVDACNKLSKSLIFTAVERDNVDIVRLLIGKGANVNACNMYGENPVFSAVEEGNVDIVRLLIDNGADVNACNVYGESPIFTAVEEGNVDIVRLLVDKGADVNACNKDGESPVFAAVEGGNVEIVRLLVDKGADVTARNMYGDSPLSIAERKGNLEIVSVLKRKNC